MKLEARQRLCSSWTSEPSIEALQTLFMYIEGTKIYSKEFKALLAELEPRKSGTVYRAFRTRTAYKAGRAKFEFKKPLTSVSADAASALSAAISFASDFELFGKTKYFTLVEFKGLPELLSHRDLLKATKHAHRRIQKRTVDERESLVAAGMFSGRVLGSVEAPAQKFTRQAAAKLLKEMGIT